MSAALMSSLAEYSWQFFVGFSFRRERVPGSRRLSMFRGVVRQQARAWGQHFDSVDWLLRAELGEATSRFHFHALIAGLPQRAVTPRNCLAIMSQWENMGGGIARARVYTGCFDGAAYILKGLEGVLTIACESRKDSYEVGKYGWTSGEVMVSERLLSRLARRRFGPARRRPSNGTSQRLCEQGQRWGNTLPSTQPKKVNPCVVFDRVESLALTVKLLSSLDVG